MFRQDIRRAVCRTIRLTGLRQILRRTDRQNLLHRLRRQIPRRTDKDCRTIRRAGHRRRPHRVHRAVREMAPRQTVIQGRASIYPRPELRLPAGTDLLLPAETKLRLTAETKLRLTAETKLLLTAGMNLLLPARTKLLLPAAIPRLPGNKLS